MEADIPSVDGIDRVHDAFLQELLQLEKRYAHELLGAKSERRSKVLELINKSAAKIPQSLETAKD
jgi:hypothetical protein